MESERGSGAGSTAGGNGAEVAVLGVRAGGGAATTFEGGGASRGTSKLSGGDSMI